MGCAEAGVQIVEVERCVGHEDKVEVGEDIEGEAVDDGEAG